MSKDTANKSRRELLKKSAYVVPAVLTMAIAPPVSKTAYADSTGKGKGKGEPASVPEPGVVGMLGLGLASIAATKALKKRHSKK